MNVHAPTKEARRSNQWFSSLPDTLSKAIVDADLYTTEAYGSLQELATAVSIDGFSIDAESSVIENSHWIAPGTIFVTLTYDPNSDDPVVLPDSFPITVYFAVDEHSVDIQKITADTSSFYE